VASFHNRPAGAVPPVPRRVLVLSHTAQTGGAELALERLVRAMAPSGHRLTVVLLEHGPMEERLAEAGAAVRVVELSQRFVSASRFDLLRRPTLLVAAATELARAARAVVRVGRELDVEVVWSNTIKAHVLGVLVQPALRRPLVWYLHDRIAVGYLPRPAVTALRLLARLPDAVVSNSAATAATVPRPARIAYPGFAPEQALGRDQVRRRELPERPTFLMLGRISPTKGQLEFVEGAAAVLERHPDARFVVVGSPMFGADAYFRGVQERARRLRVEHAIEWLPFASDTTHFLDTATALVHASPVAEPFGQVVLEAVVRGVPVIATRAGGVPEILGTDDGEPRGLLVPPGDPDALASAMIRVLEHPGQATERAARAHDHAMARFGIERTVRQMEQVWAEVSGPRRRYRAPRPWPPPARTSPERQTRRR